MIRKTLIALSTVAFLVGCSRTPDLPMSGGSTPSASSTGPGSVASGATAGPILAADKEKNLAAGETDTKQLLRLMDRNQNGKVSKQEFMSFMEAEFNRLDKNKNDELDVGELTELRVRPSKRPPGK
jgi:hypothetical protein